VRIKPGGYFTIIIELDAKKWQNKIMTPWLYSLLAVLIVSFVSLVGVLALSLKRKLLKKLILFLVAFAAGGLLGDAFIHLLPHSAKELGLGLSFSVSILGGFLLFFYFGEVFKMAPLSRY